MRPHPHSLSTMPNAGQNARRHQRPPTHTASAVGVTLLAALILMAVSTSAAWPSAPAETARTLNVTDTAHLHYVRESGSMLVDEGTATGALPGKVKVRFSVGATVKASFAIYTHNGNLLGHGTAALSEHKQQPGHTNVYASFAGTITVSTGTGRYAHAHGSGGLYGTINRKTYAVTIQTTGNLSY